MRRQLLKPADMPRRVAFCTWVLQQTDQQLLKFLFSDEAMFQLCGHVNSHNIRRSFFNALILKPLSIFFIICFSLLKTEFLTNLSFFFCRYAPLKTSDPVRGGRPAHFAVDKPTFSPKIMVFCGVRYSLTKLRHSDSNGDNLGKMELLVLNSTEIRP